MTTAVARTLPMTLEQLLEDARSGLRRLTPLALRAAIAADPDLLILDVRTPTDRALFGCIPGSLHMPRTVLEWRVAPDAPLRSPEIRGLDQYLVVVCNEGFSSSLAAATLQRLGFVRATDLIGGVIGWAAAGFPVEPPQGDEIGLQH